MKHQFITIGCILTIIYLMSPFDLYAQQKPIQLEQMQKFEALHGQWSGSGWHQMGPGPKNTFNQTENIYTKLDGLVLIIEGHGTAPDTNETVFQALGVMSYDADSAIYRFDTHTLDGHHGQGKAKLENNVFTWWFEIPTGTVRYTITFTDETWSEDGHFSPDGEKWYQFFHMDLKKLS